MKGLHATFATQNSRKHKIFDIKPIGTQNMQHKNKTDKTVLVAFNLICYCTCTTSKISPETKTVFTSQFIAMACVITQNHMHTLLLHKALSSTKTHHYLKTLPSTAVPRWSKEKFACVFSTLIDTFASSSLPQQPKWHKKWLPKYKLLGFSIRQTFGYFADWDVTFNRNYKCETQSLTVLTDDMKRMRNQQGISFVLFELVRHQYSSIVSQSQSHTKTSKAKLHTYGCGCGEGASSSGRSASLDLPFSHCWAHPS